MAIMYALIMLMAASLFLAAAMKEKAETVFPCTLLSVVVILYPFYCLDKLQLGLVLVYAALLAAVAVAFGVLLKEKRPLLRSILDVLTPGVFIYALFCGFVFFYTRGNLVGLWDEMRLWGAVPKALYTTHALQLGKDALIFGNMQPYPPGMPLLVYFMEALSPTFSEGYIFVVYGIFFGAMLLPALRNLQWKHWPWILPLAILMAYIPCIFTSHGGDFAWFYESLFIDPVLGILAGYTFFLSATKPFASSFSVYRFGAALLVLTIIKDSGAMFALLAAMNAVILYAMDNKGRMKWKNGVCKVIQVLIPIAAGYGIWKYMLSIYGVSSNEAGFLRLGLSWESITAMWTELTQKPMLVLMDPIFATEIQLTYIPCILILLTLSFLCVRSSNKDDKAVHGVTWGTMVLSFVVFLIGYRMSFRNSLPSFQRYVSTTLFAALAFFLLYAIPVLMECIAWGATWKLSKKSVLAAVIGVAVLHSAYLSLEVWQENKYDMRYTIAPAKAAVSKVLPAAEGSIENPSDLYVMISDDPRQKSLVHHRIYYELLGTKVCVRNFWHDVNLIVGKEIPESWTQDEIVTAAQNWAKQLRSVGYEYVYVVSVNDYTSQVLAQLGIAEAAVGDMYAVIYTGNEVSLVKV